jgi:hypothetical protein
VPEVAVDGVGYGDEATASSQYVYVNPAVLPAVIEGFVRSTVEGEHTATGLVIIREGCEGTALITTSVVAAEVHPAEFVTV